MFSFSSGLSYVLYVRKKSDKWIALILAIGIPLLVILFGYWRLSTAPTQSLTSIGIGLISINTPHLAYDKEAKELSPHYLKLIEKAAQEGAQYIVLPERFISIDNKNYTETLPLFEQAAREYHVTLVLGIGRMGEESYNSAIVIGADGHIVGTYDKHHLLPKLEARFTPGKTLLQRQDAIRWGLAICKDMDFLDISRAYGQKGVQVLFVPALDFNVDAWYHGRIAIMRGIENGFVVARAAAHGNLSVTDQWGRIVSMKADFYKTDNIIVATINVYDITTLYRRWGSWFVYLLLMFLGVAFIFRVKNG